MKKAEDDIPELVIMEDAIHDRLAPSESRENRVMRPQPRLLGGGPDI